MSVCLFWFVAHHPSAPCPANCLAAVIVAVIVIVEVVLIALVVVVVVRLGAISSWSLAKEIV